MPTLSRRHWLLLLLFLVAGYFEAGNAAHTIGVLWRGSQAPDAYFPVRLATREFGSDPYWLWKVLAIDGKPFTRGQQVQEAIDARRPGDEIPVTLKTPKGEIKEVKIKIYSAIRPERGIPTSSLS